jgi:uncharacterized membrane protein (DUF4010 family)
VSDELAAAARLAIAALVGVGVGLERQWSGHASGPAARFAGLRTFFMLGLAGGAAGLLAGRQREMLGATAVAGAIALIVTAYALAVRRREADLDATTEAAAIVVVVLGALAGLGWMALAAGTGSVVVLALHEKSRLHGAVQRLGETELRAALRFAVLALVVLPLLPSTAVLGTVELSPRALWAIVLFFSALNFAAYIAQRVVRPDRGYGLTGMLGGFISSTGVTLLFSRRSRADPASSRALAVGVIGACTILVPRVLVVSAALNPPVALELLPYLLPALVAGGIAIGAFWRSAAPAGEIAAPRQSSPLRIHLAIGMAAAFQISMMLVEYAAARWSAPGLYTTATLLGLTDVDALTVSMSRGVEGMEPGIAARGIAVGILANTGAKLILAATLGTARFRFYAAGGLLLMGVLSATALWLLR